MTTAEKLVRIAENEPKVYEAGRKEGMSFVSDNVGNALKGNASGETIVLKDVSPIEHNLGVKVESKNLISVAQGTTTRSGVTFSADENGVITCNGISTGDIYCQINDKAIELVSGMYTLSGCPVGGAWDKYLIYAETEGVLFDDIGSGKSFGIKEDKKYNVLIYIPRNVTVEHLVFKPQLEKGTMATPYTPYIADIEEVKVLAQEANLLSLDKFENNSWDNTVLENGTIKQVAADTASPFSFKVQYLVNGSYHQLATIYNISSPQKIVASFTCDNPLTYLRFGVNGNQRDTIASFRDLNLPAGDYTLSLDLTNATQGSISWRDMQLEYGGLSDYKPYKEPIEYAQGEDIKSIHPSTTLMTDTAGAVMTVEYNRDINDAFAELLQRILSLGG